MKRKYIMMALAIVLIFSMAGAGTMAWFTNVGSSEANTFNTGKLEIVAGNETSTIPHFQIKDLQPSFRYPGADPDTDPAASDYAYEPVRGHFILTNSGTMPAKVYRMTVGNIVDSTDRTGRIVAVTDDLLRKLFIQVIAKGYTPSAGAPVADDTIFVGSLYNMKNDNQGHFDPFVFMNPGDHRDIEFAVSLARNAGNEYQNMNLEVSFTVYATQVEAPVSANETNPTAYVDLFSSASPNFKLAAKEGYHSGVFHLGQFTGFSGDAYNFRFTGITGKPFKSMTLELKHESDNSEEMKVTRVGIFTDKLEVDNIDKKYVDYEEITTQTDKYIFVSRAGIPAGWKLIEVQATYNWSDGTSISTGWLPYGVGL